MRNGYGQADSAGSRHRAKTCFWQAFGITLALHGLLLIWEIERTQPRDRTAIPSLEVELTRTPDSLSPPLPVPVPPPSPVPVEPVAPTKPLPPSGAPVKPPDPIRLETNRAETGRPVPEALRTRLLASPYLNDSNDMSDMFGPVPVTSNPLPDFRYPERRDLLAELKNPLPELPFEDPGLVEFAYDPGAMGVMQRGFDRITPEFGFTTNSGFKVRCRWVVVVVGCAWGRER